MLIIIKRTIDVHLIMCTYDFRMLPEFNQSQQIETQTHPDRLQRSCVGPGSGAAQERCEAVPNPSVTVRDYYS